MRDDQAIALIAAINRNTDAQLALAEQIREQGTAVLALADECTNLVALLVDVPPQDGEAGATTDLAGRPLKDR
jgi:hypothetical protein